MLQMYGGVGSQSYCQGRGEKKHLTYFNQRITIKQDKRWIQIIENYGPSYLVFTLEEFYNVTLFLIIFMYSSKEKERK